jgi:23S rRNA (cytosine1962-C5)-methyltransferase
MCNGHADGARGLAVDRYGDVAVVHADSSSVMARWLPEVRVEVSTWCPTAYVKLHPRTTARLSEKERRELAPEEPVWGMRREEVEVVEVGVRYLVRPTVGLSVGLFLDMREVREWLRETCRDRSVLNLFAYTCSLGVCAVLGGASRVVNVDLSRSYLEWGKANYALNGVPVDNQDFIYGDAFDWLSRFARRSQTFDVVIVDPPSFSSTPFSVARDYVRLAAAAARVVSAGGCLVAATNHAQTSEGRFEAWLTEGLFHAGRRGGTLAHWHEPTVDFPVSHGERPYLKVRALEVT